MVLVDANATLWATEENDGDDSRTSWDDMLTFCS